MNYRLTITKIGQQTTTLLTKDQQEITWPTNQLPPDSQVGSVLTCVLINPTQPNSDSQALAQAILNELLKNYDHHAPTHSQEQKN